MTINTTLSRVDYVGNGATTAFPVPFPFFGPDELLVIERDTVTGAETTLVRGASYAVAGGLGATGTVTATVAPAAGKQWTILRDTLVLQQIDYTRNDPFPAETVERGVDRLTAIAQEIERDAARGVRVAATDATAVVLPNSIERANKVLSFDAQGNPVMLPVGAGGGVTGPAGAAGPQGDSVPVGAGMWFAGAVLPAGWLWCNGVAVSRTTYAALFAAIGVTHGGGDGATTFNLPNVQGRVVVGREGMGGVSAPNLITVASCGLNGAVLGASGGSAGLQSHTHAASDPGHAHAAVSSTIPPHNHGGAALPQNVADVDRAAAGASSLFSIDTQVTLGLDGEHTPTITVAANTTGITIGATGSGGSQNVQPSIVENYIIYAGGALAGGGGGGSGSGFVAEQIGLACSDETTALTAGAAKVTLRMPFGMNLLSVRASLTTASSSGVVTVDLNEGGVSILSTKLTIDASERTSATAAVPPVISDAALADDAEMTVDIDTAGAGATGLKLWLVGTRAI